MIINVYHKSLKSEWQNRSVLIISVIVILALTYANRLGAILLADLTIIHQ